MESEEQLKEQRRIRQSWSNGVSFVLVCAALALGIFLHRYQTEAFAEAAAYSAGGILLAMQAFWGNRRHLWFWAFALCLAVFHLLFVLEIPWPRDHLMNKADTLIALPDIALSFGVMALAARIFRSEGSATK